MNEMSGPTAIDYNKQVTQLAQHDGRQAIRDELVSAGRAGLNADAGAQVAGGGAR